MFIRLDKQSKRTKDIRRTSKYKKFASSFILKKGKCEICDSTSNLQVHHIKSVFYFPELLLDEDNCMCLCSGVNRFSGCHFIHGHLSDFKINNPNVRVLIKKKE